MNKVANFLFSFVSKEIERLASREVTNFQKIDSKSEALAYEKEKFFS